MSQSKSEANSDAEGKFTRREFVGTLGAVGGGLALGLPQGSYRPSSSPSVADRDVQTTPANLVALQLVINGTPHKLNLDPRTTLLDLLRERLSLTGTKKGCDHGQCGACTVLINGQRINSCLALAVTHDGDQVTTIEGLAKDRNLHPMQAAFLEHDGFQCGFCTPGQVCSAIAAVREAQEGWPSVVSRDLVAEPIELTSDEIRERMSGNICRCGAYPGIVAAVTIAARQITLSKVET
jgi:xanthine dehydrogenase YagT iron-sulfur-binding subunit